MFFDGNPQVWVDKTSAFSRDHCPGTAGHIAPRGGQGQKAGGRLAQQRVALQALELRKIMRGLRLKGFTLWLFVT